MANLRVKDVGEFALIAALAEALPDSVRSSRQLLHGIGDDAALWIPNVDEAVLVTTDSLIEDVHFRLDWTTWRDLGHKALAVNISDIAAMGGVPRLATISLAVTGEERLDDLRNLYRGMGTIARRFGVVIAGGDIVRAPCDFGIHVTLLGTTRFKGRFLSRSGAKPGDLVAVSGTLGAAAAGLELLRLDTDDPRRAVATAQQLIEAHTRPEPRIRLATLVLDHSASSAMDLSDGLYGDLGKILAASQVGAVIDVAAIPVAASVRALFPDRYLELATRGGEDYELLFTIAPDRFAFLSKLAAEARHTITVIGHIVPMKLGESQLHVRDLNGTLRSENTSAFDHFG